MKECFIFSLQFFKDLLNIFFGRTLVKPAEEMMGIDLDHLSNSFHH